MHTNDPAVERRKAQRLNLIKDIKPSKPVDRNKFPGCYDFASLYPSVQKTIIPENWKELKRKKLIAERKAKLEKINSICQE
jgi:hypothetical protein